MKLTFNVTGNDATLMLKRPSKSVITPCDVPSTMTLAENIGSPVSPSLTNPTRVVWATMAVDMAHNTSIHPAFPTKDVVRAAGIKKASTKRMCAGLVPQDAQCPCFPPASARKVVHGTHEQLVWKSALLGDDAPRFRRVQRHVYTVAWAQLPPSPALFFTVDPNEPFVDQHFRFAPCGCDARGFQKLKEVDVLRVNGKSRIGHHRKDG